MRLEGNFELWDKAEKAVCILRETGKKEFLINDQPYDKFSQHIGRYPCVIIAPDDVRIITEGSEERRKFIDTLISQFDADYLQHLIQYNRIILQRNSLLKNFYETGKTDLPLLEVLNEQLIPHCNALFEKRKDFLVSFLPMVKKLYNEISGQFENVMLVYESELLHNNFDEMIRFHQQRDLAACRTTCGIHKDDIDLTMDEQPFKNIASQGQRKSLLFALKLAEMEVLKKEKGFAPLLLLDDVFEKLDEDRIGNLLQRVCIENEGQVFITDTNKERLTTHLQNIAADFEVCEI